MIRTLLTILASLISLPTFGLGVALILFGDPSFRPLGVFFAIFGFFLWPWKSGMRRRHRVPQPKQSIRRHTTQKSFRAAEGSSRRRGRAWVPAEEFDAAQTRAHQQSMFDDQQYSALKYSDLQPEERHDHFEHVRGLHDSYYSDCNEVMPNYSDEHHR